jgi:hypothetical protein
MNPIKERIVLALQERKQLNEELVTAALMGSALGLLTIIVAFLTIDTYMEPTSLKNRLRNFANFITGKNARLLKKVKALVDEDKELYDIILNGTTKRGFKPNMRNKFEQRLKQLLPAEDFRDIMDLATHASKEVRKRKVDEEVLSEAATMKLDKVNIVKVGPGTEKFAKEYVAAMKGDFRDGGPTPADEKAADKFYANYTNKTTRKGFAGSGTVEYTNKATKETFVVDKSPNGKGFHGTDHTITKK